MRCKSALFYSKKGKLRTFVSIALGGGLAVGKCLIPLSLSLSDDDRIDGVVPFGAGEL